MTSNHIYVSLFFSKPPLTFIENTLKSFPATFRPEHVNTRCELMKYFCDVELYYLFWCFCRKFLCCSIGCCFGLVEARHLCALFLVSHRSWQRVICAFVCLFVDYQMSDGEELSSQKGYMCGKINSMCAWSEKVFTYVIENWMGRESWMRPFTRGTIARKKTELIIRSESHDILYKLWPSYLNTPPLVKHQGNITAAFKFRLSFGTF